MSRNHTPTTAVKAHPDGSVTFPKADVEIIQSALLWARIGAVSLAKSCEELTSIETFTPDQRATQARNAEYHTERATQAADLEERISAAQVKAQ